MNVLCMGVFGFLPPRRSALLLTATVGGWNTTGFSNGFWGGNAMKPEPTTFGFCAECTRDQREADNMFSGREHEKLQKQGATPKRGPKGPSGASSFPGHATS